VRRSLVVAFAVLAAAAPAGCSGRPSESARQESGRDERVVRFWESFHEATRLRLAGRFGDAERSYLRALTIDPRHEDSLYYLGQCRLQTADRDGALEAFRTLVSVNPASARGHLSLGALLASPDGAAPFDPVEAEAHFRRAHDINGEETAPMVRLGEVLILLERPDEARRWLDAAFASNPKSVEAAFLGGYLRWEKGDLNGAAAFYRRAVDAAASMAPVRGVLSEGDRRPAASGRLAPPPLRNPMGETLFGEFSAHLREQGVARPAGSEPDLDEIYPPVRAFVRDLARRKAPPPS